MQQYGFGHNKSSAPSAPSAPVLVSSGMDEILPMSRGGDPRKHVSVVVNDLCMRLGHIDMQERDTVSRNLMAYWELGNSFEEGIVLGLTQLGRVSRLMQTDVERYVRPGSVELDGIVGNPDLLDLLEQAVIEIKLTKISSRHEPTSEKFWKYWAQSKAYAYMMGWTRVYLHVGHINADYKGSIEPHYHVWRWDFLQYELQENWEMLKRHSSKLISTGAGAVR